jgi:hypothetical protein
MLQAFCKVLAASIQRALLSRDAARTDLVQVGHDLLPEFGQRGRMIDPVGDLIIPTGVLWTDRRITYSSHHRGPLEVDYFHFPAASKAKNVALPVSMLTGWVGPNQQINVDYTPRVISGFFPTVEALYAIADPAMAFGLDIWKGDGWRLTGSRWAPDNLSLYQLQQQFDADSKVFSPSLSRPPYWLGWIDLEGVGEDGKPIPAWARCLCIDCQGKNDRWTDEEGHHGTQRRLVEYYPVPYEKVLAMRGFETLKAFMQFTKG